MPRLQQLTIEQGITLGPDVPVVTFISRNLGADARFPYLYASLAEPTS